MLRLPINSQWLQGVDEPQKNRSTHLPKDAEILMTEHVGLEEHVGMHMIQRLEPQMKQKSMKPEISNVILAVPFRKLEMRWRSTNKKNIQPV